MTTGLYKKYKKKLKDEYDIHMYLCKDKGGTRIVPRIIKVRGNKFCLNDVFIYFKYSFLIFNKIEFLKGYIKKIPFWSTFCRPHPLPVTLAKT